MATEADIEFRLSGGVVNTSVTASLGGPMSRAAIRVTPGSFDGPLTGVRYVDSSGNPTGTGTLTYVAAAKTLAWTPAGGAAGPARDISATGLYAIRGSGNAFLTVFVVAISLPDADTQIGVAIQASDGSLFPDYAIGDMSVRYRCQYLYNQHDADSIAATLRLVGSGDALEFGLAVESAGAEVAAVANETTEPPGVVFGTSDLDAGVLGPQQGVGIWLRRKPSITSGTVSAFLQALV